MEAAATPETCSDPSPSSPSYADAVSPVYPDRPIRPLPKRRLKSRLSSEAAESILSASPSGPPERLFQLPFFDTPGPSDRASLRTSSVEVHESEGLAKQRQNPPGTSEGTAGDDAGKAQDRQRGSAKVQPGRLQIPATTTMTTGSSSSVKAAPQTGAGASWDGRDAANAQPVTTSADSIDGYESFENTNNKKKRKIPTSGGHHASLSSEMASAGRSPSRDVETAQFETDVGLAHYTKPEGAANTVRSAATAAYAGKPRSSRPAAWRRSGRSPLGVSVNGSNRAGPEYVPAAGEKGGENGVKDLARQALPTKDNVPAFAEPPLSRTATAGTTRAATMGPQGGEGGGGRSPNGKSQFTFTCESEASKSVVWPTAAGPDPFQAGALPYDSSRMPAPGDSAVQPHNAAPASGAQSVPGALPNPPQRKRRIPLAKQYAIAARDRRLRQNYGNFHHPPKEEDVWVCEYCEYEAIFGCLPEALIRQYEIRDRRERKRLAEKRRLLEKAKMKNRKGKKGSNAKSGAKPNAPLSAQEAAALQQDPYGPEAYDDDGTPLDPLDPSTPYPDDYYVDDDYGDILPPLDPHLPAAGTGGGGGVMSDHNHHHHHGHQHDHHHHDHHHHQQHGHHHQQQQQHVPGAFPVDTPASSPLVDRRANPPTGRVH